MKILVIVESPGKIKKIESYLGANYIVKASYGHCRDLDPKSLSIDVENKFHPNYKIIDGKTKVVKELRALAKDCNDVILAADEDREGEMIASSLADLLSLKNPKRIVFHEITKKALNEAVQNPTTINYNMVYAQQARRLLDRIVGYKLSPLLWKSMTMGTSAGRVQSVVVRVIVDKENEINESISSPYFKLIGEFIHKKEKIRTTYHEGKKQKYFDNKDDIMKLLSLITKDTEFIVTDTYDKESTRNPSAPFITSSLQQDAHYKLGFNGQRTMMAAQKLYEAGYITYMRTDSTNLSAEAINGCKSYILDKWGKKYLQIRSYNKKTKGAQEAHEAIRPTDISKTKLKGSSKDDPDQSRLYDLIWKRTVASQMSSAKFNITTMEIDAQNNKKTILGKKEHFESSYQTMIFDGFMIIYNNSSDESEEDGVANVKFDKIEKNTILSLNNLTATEEYTKPPSRFNEASLIKHLEKLGIGRPSTYAAIISKIVDRKYVELGNIDGVKKSSIIITLNSKLKINEKSKEIIIGREKNKIIPTAMGTKVNNFLIENFTEIMDIEFTAKMEKLLDKIASGDKKWYKVLQSFYDRFNPKIDKLALEYKDSSPGKIGKDDILLGKDKSGKEIYKTVAKYGPVVKMLEDGKWKYGPIKKIDGVTFNNIKLEKAIEILMFPIYLGKYKNSKVYLNRGEYGLYLKYGTTTTPIKNKDLKFDEISLELATQLIQKHDSEENKIKLKDKIVYIKNGPYGPYLTYMKGKKRINIKIPDNLPIDKITKEDCESLVNQKRKWSKKRKTS